jgi:serine/threonine protein kinase
VQQNTCIAYKRIQRKFMKEEQWQKAKREVYVLRERRGEYITPLLGSFLAGMHDTSSGKECLYLLSPQAKYDMESWMQNPPDEWIGHTEDRLRQHIYRETIPGLISGLTWIHREINHRVGYHRDIKPSNILLFEKGAQELVWKICDFGSSNLKEANDTATTNLITSWKWAPPEFFTDDDTNDGEKHGRTHDVYSMGCVFLCLATMLRFGWRSEGLEQFEKDRINIKDDRENVRDSSDEASFHKSEKAIHKWIVYLQEIRRQDEDKEVLALIEEMLQPRNKRIFSWEVEIDLFIILDKRGHPEEIAERLSKIIQKSRGTNLQTHNPYVRAKEKARLEKGTVKKRSPEFFRILAKGRWQEYVPQSTTDGLPSVASVQSPLSNFPPSKHRTGGIYGGQGLYTSISAGFRHSDIVVLYGMAGVG